MGMVFGKIDVETPAHKVISTQDGWEHRRYPAAVAAEVSTASFETRADFDNQAFRVLANYIGVFGTPKNKAATTGVYSCNCIKTSRSWLVVKLRYLARDFRIGFILFSFFTVAVSPICTGAFFFSPSSLR
eukprot:m.117322 g.117322  ORF g.117322 m.117322 type:complete len:130 (+) comp16396_c0_seq9:420-809(+)